MADSPDPLERLQAVTLERHRGKVSHAAECETCHAFYADGDVLSWARKHAVDERHDVFVVAEYSIRYDGRPHA